jgi:hypothetical protein
VIGVPLPRLVSLPRLAVWLLPLFAIGGAVGGCVSKPFLSAGNATSAEVGYAGNLAAATEVAREHCARYDKVPRYLDSAENIAFFACEKH